MIWSVEVFGLGWSSDGLVLDVTLDQVFLPQCLSSCFYLATY